MARLDEIFDLQMGKTPSRNNADYWTDGQYDWVSIADLGSYQKYVEDTKERISALAVQESGIKSVPANTVIMSFKLSLGKTAITQEPVYTNEAIMAFIPTGKYAVLPDYFYYLFSAKDWTKGTNRAVMGTTLNKATLGAVSITVPPIDEQRKIAAILDKVSDLIAKRRQQLDTLDEAVKARFVEIFGDPVSNPKRWKMERTEKHIDLLSGFPFDSTQYTECGINICGGLIIMPQKINWDDCKHWNSVKGYEAYTLQKDDIVVALDRPWISEGFKIAMVDEEHLPALLIQRTARIRAVDIDQNYLMYCFILGRFDVHCNVTGSLVPHISAKDIRSFLIMLPPIELQNQFATFVEQTEKIKATISRSLEKLETLKKALMQEYFG